MYEVRRSRMITVCRPARLIYRPNLTSRLKKIYNIKKSKGYRYNIRTEKLKSYDD